MKIISDFFISYRHTEVGIEKSKEIFRGRYIAEETLYKSLKRKGYEVHYDPEYKAAGDYSERLQKAVKNCKVFLWVLSKGCLFCKSDNIAKNNDWFYAEILWALKYKKLIIPVISPEFEWLSQKEFNSNFNRAFHMLTESGYLNKDDKVILEKAKKLYQVEGHMECIVLDDNFKVDTILNLIKKAKKDDRKNKKPIKYKKLKRLFLYFILLVLIVFTLYEVKEIYDAYKNPHIWNGSMTIENGWNSVKGDGTVDSPYEIETAEQLAWLAYTTQASTCEGKYYKLVNDIYLNEYNVDGVNNDIGGAGNLVQVEGDRYLTDIDNIHEWKPIGNSDYPFAGSFNGNGHTIKGLYINSDKDFQGLFGVCDSESRIENVNLYCATINSNGSCVGGIAGKSEGLINGCTVYSLYITGKSYVGGIVGSGNVVVNCFSNLWMTCGEKEEKCYGGLTGVCNYLVNSSSSMVCYNLNNCDFVGELAGSVLIDAYNCVALSNECFIDIDELGKPKSVELDAWKMIENIDENKLLDRKIYCRGQVNEQENSNNTDLLYTRILFNEAAANILNKNVNEINNDNELLEVLQLYGQNGKILELSSWITWKNPKGVWMDVEYAPFLKNTFNIYDKDEWSR